MIRSTAQRRLTAVGRALIRALAEPRRVARRAYGMPSRWCSALSDMPIAATWPMAGAPRTTISRIAKATSPADLHGYSTRASGRRRWSMRYRTPPSSRNGVRNPLGPAPPTAAPGVPLASSPGGPSSRAAPSGLRMTLAASAEACWSAWAAPATVAAVLISSPAKARKNRRRPMSTGGGALATFGSSAVCSSPGTLDPSASGGWLGLGSLEGSVNLGTSMRDGPSVLDDARHPTSLEPVAALEELELNEEREADHLALEPFDQLDRPVHGTACGEQVVDDQHLLTRRDRIAVDLEGVGSVLERIFDGDRLRRQLAQL